MSDRCLCDQIETFVVVSLLDVRQMTPQLPTFFFSFFHKYPCVMESSFFVGLLILLGFYFVTLLLFLPPVSLRPSRVNQTKGADINQTFTLSFKFVLKIPTLRNCQEQQ